MGIIDTTTYNLTCSNCGASETAKVNDKGSQWNGSYWQSGATFKLFDTHWEGGGDLEPMLKSSSCKQCGAAPIVKSS